MSDSRIVDADLVYAETIDGVSAQLFLNGTLCLRRDDGVAFIFPWLTDLESGKSWVPSRETFVKIVGDSLRNNEYDFDTEMPCLLSFMSSLRELLKNDKSLRDSTQSPDAK